MTPLIAELGPVLFIVLDVFWPSEGLSFPLWPAISLSL